MSETIRVVILELNEEIALKQAAVRALEAAVRALEDLAVGHCRLTPGMELPRIETLPLPKSDMPRRIVADARKARTRRAGARGGSGLGEESLKELELVRGLEEPITAPAVEKVCRCEHKRAQNFITQNLGRGFLTRCGKGEYRKTKKYPTPPGAGARPLPADAGAGTVEKDNGHRVAIAGLDRPERTVGLVEEELRMALKERDHSRAAGREAMATIQQSKVEKLQRELDGINPLK